MDKRFQVFVSSTFEDLQQERQRVVTTLLGMDCFPACMELFPAADDGAWEFIKTIIDDCDSYVVLVGGRYGSVDSEGMSFTEKEYRYALEKGKPVIGFIHGDPGKIPAEKCETDATGKEKLATFRALVQKKVCKKWMTAEGLAGEVAVSLQQLMKTREAVGWVRGDSVADGSAREVMQLREMARRLEIELQGFREAGVTDDLADGEEMFKIRCKVIMVREQDGAGKQEVRTEVGMSWSTIRRLLLSRLVTSKVDYDDVARLLWAHILEAKLLNGVEGMRRLNCDLDRECVLSVCVQMEALGVMERDPNGAYILGKHGKEALLKAYGVRKQKN